MERHWLALVLVLSTGCISEPGENERPEIVEGTIDVSGWDFATDGALELDGLWLFSWSTFVEPGPWDTVRRSFDGFANVPGSWDDQSYPGNKDQKLPGTGFGTYALRVIGLDQQDVSLRIYGIPGAASVCVGDAFGRCLNSGYQGIPSESSQDEIPVVYLPTSTPLGSFQDRQASGVDAGILLFLRVSSHHYPRGGVWVAPLLESTADWSHFAKLESLTSQALFGILLIVGIYHLVLFILRREDKAPLFFGAFALSVALRLFSMGLAQRIDVGRSIEGFISLMQLELLSVSLISACFGLFLQSLVGSETFAKIIKYWFIGGGIILGTFTVATVPTTFANYLPVYQIYSLGCVIASIWHLAYCSSRGSRLALWCLVALIIMGLGALNDILLVLRYIDSEFFGPYTVMGFILLQAGLIAARNAQAQAKVERLSEHLQDEVTSQTIELQAQTDAAIKAKEESEALRARAQEDAKKLREVDVQKTIFFQNISHELRTPLTLILNPLNSALGGDPENEELSMARRNCMRLLRLVNQLLEFQKLSASKRELELAGMDAVSFLAIVYDYFRSAAAHRSLHYRATINGVELESIDTMIPVLGDHEALETIVFNYLSNALKFCPEHGTIEIGVVELGARIRIFVRDSGPGISGENRSKLFQVFSQIDATSSRAHEGTGLGLALCKSLATEMDGEVGVDSTLGDGATFWVELPRAAEVSSRVDEHCRPKEWLLDVQPESGSGDLVGVSGEGNDHVLVVDDLVDMRTLIGGILRTAGYKVSTAVDGESALKAVAAEAPDLIVSDWMMPGMDGLELVKSLRLNPETEGTPVIMLTARSDSESRIESLSEGVDAFLGKPFSDVELISLVRNLLNLKAQEKTLSGYSQRLEEAVAALKSAELERVEATRLSTLSRISSGLAHELRNPLNIIRGVSDTLDDRQVENPTDPIPRLLGQAVNRAEAVVQRLISLSDPSPSAAQCSMDDAIESSLDVVAGELEGAGIDLQVGVIPDVDVTMSRADLSQVIVHLLQNSLEACSRGSVVSLNCDIICDQVRIEVTDTGHGISDSVSNQMFEPYFTTKLERNASGLGLTFSKRLLTEAGGSIEYLGSENSTCFVIHVPCISC